MCVFLNTDINAVNWEDLWILTIFNTNLIILDQNSEQNTTGKNILFFVLRNCMVSCNKKEIWKHISGSCVFSWLPLRRVWNIAQHLLKPTRNRWGRQGCPTSEFYWCIKALFLTFVRLPFSIIHLIIWVNK